MNILITGITGFIGKHLYKELKKEHNIFALVREESDISFFKEKENIIYVSTPENMSISLKEKNIEFIIHLASLYLYNHKHEQVVQLVNSNILLGTTILEAAVNTGIKYFINTGTIFQHYNKEPYNPVNLYAATKQAFEDIAKYYYEVFDLNFVTLKLADTYGPNDTRRKIFTLWQQIAETGEELKMSPGEQIIDIVHVEKVIDAYKKLIEMLVSDNDKKLKGKVFSIKNSNRKTLKQLAKDFEKEIGKKLNIKWGALPYRDREIMEPWHKGIIIK